MDDKEVLSSVLGWLSIGCCPQFIENYQLKSGEGLSVAFIIAWLAGDLANLIGAVLAHLLPTLIVLAVYYSLCDIGLLCQIYYYRYTHPVHLSPPEPSESAPLLPPQKGAPAQRHLLRRLLRHLIPYVLGTLFVLLIGATAYWMNIKEGQDRGEDPTSGERVDVLEWKSQLLGWISALLYLGSRIPQICEIRLTVCNFGPDTKGKVKNLVTKCAGLSPVLFVFGIAGNVLYVASILVVSTEAKYLAVNSSWLAGSGLTIFLDLIVLVQFVYFRTTQRVFVPDENASQAPDP